ncbi:MAG: autotransporter-associated beta strand repeat-containing protein [Luteolibacter sp.]
MKASKNLLNNRLRLSGICLSTLFITFGGQAVHAADLNWDAGGGADTDFNTALNWETDSVPVAGDNAYINNTATITGDLYSSGSRLNVLQVGSYFGTGAMTQTAGTVYTAGFNVGFIGTGVYNLNGTGSINMTNDFLVGHAGYAAGLFGDGTFNMNTIGTLTTNYVNVAATDWGFKEASGTFNMAAGTVDSTFGFRVGGDSSATAGHSGTMNISGGTVNSNGNFAIGDGSAGAKGFLVMTGGTLNVSSEFYVGNGHADDYSTIGHGTATISSGVLNVGSWFGVGRNGSEGTLTISGDAVVNQGITDAGSRLELGNFGANNTSILNLNGGTLAVNGIVDSGGAGDTTTFNWNGGTLKARQNNDFFLIADTINVQDGGAVIDSNGFNIRIENVLAASGTGGLTKNGAGTLTLSNANTYTGITTVSSDVLQITNDTALGTTAGATSIAAGAQVYLNANSMSVAENFILNGTTSGGALLSGDRPNGNINTLSGTITLNADSNVASWWNDKTMAFTGKITGAGGLTFDRATTLGGGDPFGGKYLLSNATNDYAGNTVVNGRPVFGNAILQLGATNALPTSTTLTLNDATLSLSGFNQTLSGLVGAGNSTVVNGNTTAMTLTVNNSVANTFDGVLGGGGTNENNFSLTKGGAGTLTLSGANSYTGNTKVNAGTLSVSSAWFADTSSITVDAIATLNLNTGATDVVAGLKVGATQYAAGVTYRATDANGGSGTGTQIAGLTGNGKLSVVAAGGYDSWKSNVANQTPSQDYNNDGVSNGIAYFMNNTGVISLPGIVGGTVTWTNGGNILASAYGVGNQFVVQTSQNLTDWLPVSTVDINASPNVNSNTTLTYTLPTGQSKWFARLVVAPN